MDQSGPIGIVLFLVALGIYFLPLLIANARGRDGQVLIGIANFLLGFTVIGWLVLLVIAFTGASKREREQQAQIAKLLEQRERQA